MQLLLILLAGFAAGFINALAGGGSFLTFPSLIAAGLPAIDANATSTIALFPAQVATTFAYRSGLKTSLEDPRINGKAAGDYFARRRLFRRGPSARDA